MPEKIPPQRYTPQEYLKGTYESRVESGFDAARNTVQVRSIGGAATRSEVAGPFVYDRAVNHEAESEKGLIIELRFAGDKKISIRPLSEYDITSTTSRLPVPSQLKEYIEGREDIRTDENRQTALLDARHRGEDRDGYDRATLQAVKHFLHDNPRGANILTQLSMESANDMEQLSVQDSIRLVGYIVASATSYNQSATKGRFNEADMLSSLDILRRGLSAEESEDVVQLGVCRNYADMTKSIFQSLKRINPNLRNTHCVSRGGIGSATDGRMLSKGESQRAHAWNDFITVLPGQEVAIATVDPTSGRLNDAGELVNYDQTALRAGTHLRNMVEVFRGVEQSVLIDNAKSVQDFYVKRINKLTSMAREKYDNINDVPPSTKRMLQSLALEYIGSVREFGGGVANMATVPRGIRRLIESVVRDESIVLSPFEFASALEVVRNGDDSSVKDLLLESLEDKRQYAVKNNLARFFRRNELRGSYPEDDIRRTR
jgi:hypothetical protein